MYLGHIIFLFGLTLSLGSVLAAVITVATVARFHLRVRRDEERLAERFGQPYVDYAARVGRWLPGLH
jgi:protein-S-isoprenylcysteine O-methyltransferase Ste14